MGQDGGRHARSGVRHDEPDLAAHGSGRYADLLARGVSRRVLQQVGQDLIDEDRVHIDRGQVRRHIQVHEGRRQRRRHAVDYRVHQIREVV